MFWERGPWWGCDGRPGSDPLPDPVMETWGHATEVGEAEGRLGTAQGTL